MKALCYLPGLVLAVFGGAASAHVTLEKTETSVGSSYRAVLKVPHGCKGSPTTALRVRIPEGVIAVKPMPKQGWSLSLERGKYARTYGYLHDAKHSEGVVEIVWSGGNLPDEHYDEFVFQGYVARELTPTAVLHFEVTQQCQNGVQRWIETPQPGKPSGHLAAPAPALKLTPKR